MASDESGLRSMKVAYGDMKLDILEKHSFICDLRKGCSNGEYRMLAARALRRAFLAEVVAAWQAGEITEGQAAALTGHERDPVALREIRDGMFGRVEGWWCRHREANPPEAGG